MYSLSKQTENVHLKIQTLHLLSFNMRILLFQFVDIMSWTQKSCMTKS